MMSILGDGTRQNIEKDTTVTRSILLDTDIETDVCALGIAEKPVSTEIVLERDESSRQFIQVDNTAAAIEFNSSNVLAYEKQQQPQLFDFVHIRYQRSGLQDGARIFRLAFEQTKPGGWIEVVETGPVTGLTSQNRQQPKPYSTDKTSKLRPPVPSTNNITPSDTVLVIREQLLKAGFVDVEEKGWRSTSTAGICHRIAGVGKYLKSWCLGVLGVRWNCDKNTLNQTVMDEKTSSIHCPSRIFVIARRP